MNRSLTNALPLDISLRAFSRAELLEHLCLSGSDPLAVNGPDKTAAVPRRLCGAAVQDGRLETHLPALSWNVVRFRVER